MEFRTIKGFEGHEISRSGIVRNKKTNQQLYIYLYKEKYPMVKLWKDGGRHVLSVTTLIKNTFTTIPDLEGEVWKQIPDFPNYSVSNEGRVKNVKFNRLISQHFDKDGYCLAPLSHKGKTKTARVHQLVAKAFIPNPDILLVPDHLDLNKANNQVSNLRWATRSQNSQNQLARGIIPYRGVSLIRSNNSFLSQIQHHGRGVNIGWFATTEEAARAYDAKAREIYGEHARLNFP